MGGNGRTSSMTRLMFLVVLIAWITAFWILLQEIEGAPLISKLLRQDYWWLLDVGTGILLLFLVSMVYLEPGSSGPRGIRLALTVGIMMVPLLYIPKAVTSRLSPEALNKRLSLSQQEGFGIAGNRPSNSDTKFRSLPDDPSVYRLALWPDSYDGKRVKTLGMVYRNPNMASNTFYCCRLIMFCCAADAAPVGVLVEYHGVNHLTEGQWVRVQGRVEISSEGDRRKILIMAEKVETIDPPKNQYVYP